MRKLRPKMEKGINVARFGNVYVETRPSSLKGKVKSVFMKLLGNEIHIV